jgi:hypothetical protein
VWPPSITERASSIGSPAADSNAIADQWNQLAERIANNGGTADAIQRYQPGQTYSPRSAPLRTGDFGAVRRGLENRRARSTGPVGSNPTPSASQSRSSPFAGDSPVLGVDD